MRECSADVVIVSRDPLLIVRLVQSWVSPGLLVAEEITVSLHLLEHTIFPSSVLIWVVWVLGILVSVIGLWERLFHFHPMFVYEPNNLDPCVLHLTETSPRALFSSVCFVRETLMIGLSFSSESTEIGRKRNLHLSLSPSFTFLPLSLFLVFISEPLGILRPRRGLFHFLTRTF